MGVQVSTPQGSTLTAWLGTVDDWLVGRNLRDVNHKWCRYALSVDLFSFCSMIQVSCEWVIRKLDAETAADT
jgi:hypothetical protein